MSAGELLEIAALVEAGHRFVARQRLRSLLASLPSEGDAAVLETLVFGAALSEVIDPVAHAAVAEAGALSAGLFEVMAQAAPWLAGATRLTDQLVLESWRGASQVALVEVGLGRGRQVCSLLEALRGAAVAEGVAVPQRITVVGIEPQQALLAEGVARVGEAARRLGLVVDVHPVCAQAEELEAGEWRLLRSLCGGERVPLALTAPYVLHRVAPQARSRLLALLATELAPWCMVLAEEEPPPAASDGGLVHRLARCQAYYGARFAALGEVVGSDRELIEICGHGPEIAAILAGRSEAGCGRQTAASWRDALSEAGLVTRLPLSPQGLRERAALPERRCRIAPSVDGVVRLVVGGQTLSALVVAQAPREALERDPSAPAPAAVPPPYAMGSSLVLRLRPVPPAIDVEAYLAALCEVARADTLIHDLERAFIERQARLFQRTVQDLDALPGLDALLAARGQDVSALGPRTREAIVRDIVLLAALDGDTDEAEREALRACASRLGIADEALERFIRMASVPAALEATPSWFREAWYLGQRA